MASPDSTSPPPLKTPADLARHECLAYSHTELRTHWTFEGPDGTVSVPVSSRMMAVHGEPLLQAALAGMGFLLQPAELVSKAPSKGLLVEVLKEYRVGV